MKNFKTLLVSAALAMVTAGAVSAQSAPGTDINNSIDLTYTSGGSTISAPNAANVTFKVDRKVDLLVQGQDAGKLVLVDPDQNVANQSYLVQNKGNGSNGFDIDVTSTGSLNLTYSPTGPAGKGTFYTVISNNATPGAGTETVYNANGVVNAGDLAANGTYYVHVYANIGAGATDKQIRDITIKATALLAGTNTPVVQVRGQGLNAVDTIFTDPGTDGVEQDTEQFRVKSSVLTASKTVAVVSENANGTFNCATGTAVAGAEAAIPGACLEYTISVTNATGATTNATNLVITDKLLATLTYKAVNTGTFTSTSYNAGTTTVTGNLSTLAPGATASFTIRATVGN